MSKTITSPVKRFSGTVTLSDPLSIPQAMAFEDALDNSKKIEAELREYEFDVKGKKQSIKDYTPAKYRNAILPGICACVEKWDIEGLTNVTPETFPATPKYSSASLALWLMREITKLYNEAEEIPNA